MILTEMITGIKSIAKLLTGQCAKVESYQKEINDYSVQTKERVKTKIREIDLNIDRGQVIVKESIRIVDDVVADEFLKQSNIKKNKLKGFSSAPTAEQYMNYDKALKEEFKIIPVRAGGEVYYVGTNLKEGFIIMNKESYKLVKDFNLKAYGTDSTRGIYKLVDANKKTVAFGVNTLISLALRNNIYRDAKRMLLESKK